MRRAILASVALWLCLAGPAFAAGSAPAATPDARPAIEAEAEGPTRTLADWYAMGGPVMHVLVLCSVLVMALVLERGASLRRSRFVPRALARGLEQAIAVGQPGEIKSLCERDDSALATLCRIALEGREARDRLQAEGSACVHRAHRNLPLLAAVGNLATMLGLLGTVLGMVEAFDGIAQAGTGDARIVAGGIFRALITTAAGLGIGVLALSAHALLSRRAADLVVDLETRITRVNELLERPNRTWSARGPAEAD